MATSLHDIPGEHVASIPFREHAAATATESQYAWVAPFDCTISGLHVIFDANITGADSNYTTFGVWVDNDNTDGLMEIDYSSGTDATAGTPVVSTDTPVSAAAGNAVVIDWTKTGNGLKIPSGLLVIKYQGA